MAVLPLPTASVTSAGSFAVAAVVVRVGDDEPDLTALSTVAAGLADEISRLLSDHGLYEATAIAVHAPGPAAPVLVDRDTRTITVQDRALDLSFREFELLAFLAEHRGRVFSRRQLLSSVWDDAVVGSRTIDVHVRRLRVKLGVQASWLQTVRNIGYRFDPAGPAALAAGVARAS